MATVSLNCDLEFGSSGSASTLVNNSTKTKSVDFSREQDVLDVTAFGSSARSFAAGLANATAKVEFFWDSTIGTQLNGLIGGGAVNFQFGPDGTTTGNPKYTGSWFLKSLGQPVNIGDVKVISADFQISGAVTAATY